MVSSAYGKSVKMEHLYLILSKVDDEQEGVLELDINHRVSFQREEVITFAGKQILKKEAMAVIFFLILFMAITAYVIWKICRKTTPIVEDRGDIKQDGTEIQMETVRAGQTEEQKAQ
jgi:hypothetical protein